MSLAKVEPFQVFSISRQRTREKVAKIRRPRSWESQEVISDLLTDKLGHQTGTIQQLLHDFLQRLDFSSVVMAIRERTADMKAALIEQGDQVTSKLKSLQQQLQELEPGSAPSAPVQRSVPQEDLKEVLAAIKSIRESGHPTGPQSVDLSEVLDAIRAVPANVDLSYEFSAVLTAIQEKQPDFDLPAIQSIVSDSKQDILLQIEDMRSLFTRSQAGVLWTFCACHEQTTVYCSVLQCPKTTPIPAPGVSFLQALRGAAGRVPVSLEKDSGRTQGRLPYAGAGR